MELTELSFDSDPGTYEISTEQGRVYEVVVPEDYISPGTLVLSKEEGVPDSHEGREVLTLLDMDVKVGERVIFTISRAEEGMGEVKAPCATKVVRVGD